MKQRMKYLVIIASVLMLQSCASMDRMTEAEGNLKPANSLQAAEMLKDQMGLGYRVVGPASEKKVVREYFMYGGKKLIAKDIADRPKFKRPMKPVDFVEVDGTRLLERTVLVFFDHASADFNPSPEQQMQFRMLMADPDLKKIYIRGRTDGKIQTSADERMARRRADAAKRYLLDIGVPSEFIYESYLSADDPIADNHTPRGQDKNRRVEIEFIYDLTGGQA